MSTRSSKIYFKNEIACFHLYYEYGEDKYILSINDDDFCLNAESAEKLIILFHALKAGIEQISFMGGKIFEYRENYVDYNSYRKIIKEYLKKEIKQQECSLEILKSKLKDIEDIK